MSFSRVALLALLLASTARPQDHGYIGVWALYPPGGAAGTTVDVDIRPFRRGVTDVLVSGRGITAALLPSKEPPVDYDWQPQRGYPLFQNKCNGCHALPNPALLRYTLQEWQKVVETMVKKHGAPINIVGELNEGSLIAKYLGKATQDTTGLRARLVIAPDAPPGPREIRIVGPHWTSQVAVFEVTRGREILEIGTNSTPDAAQPLPVPAAVSGQLNEARETDWYALDAIRGRRLTLRCRSTTLNARHFFPRLRLLDAAGRLLQRSEGQRGFEPLLDVRPEADGRLFVAVDDLFSRGGRELVYRLTVDETPVDAALFPAGLRRGAARAATLAGKDVELPVRLSDAPLGLAWAETPRGRYPYVVGEFPEHVHPAAPVKLPAALNGRFLEPGQRDVFRIEVGPADLERTWAFEVFGGRIGSPAEVSLALCGGGRTLVDSERQPIAYSGKFDTNWPAYKLGTQLYGRDERFDVRFPAAGVYSLEISEAGGQAGPGFVYRIHAGPAEPDFAVAITPDSPRVHPGGSVYLEIHPLRRHGIDGPIEVSFPELPPGLSASRGVIHPGQGRSFLVLTAAPDAKPGLALRTRPVARAGALVRPVVPYEFRDHCRDPIACDELVVTVDGRPSWAVELEASSAKLKPGEALEIKVKVDRRDTPDVDVPFFVFADHADVRLSGLPTVAAGARESTITARLRKGSKADQVRIVVVNGLNEWIGATSGAMNRSSRALELEVVE